AVAGVVRFWMAAAVVCERLLHAIRRVAGRVVVTVFLHAPGRLEAWPRAGGHGGDLQPPAAAHADRISRGARSVWASPYLLGNSLFQRAYSFVVRNPRRRVALAPRISTGKGQHVSRHHGRRDRDGRRALAVVSPDGP